MSAAVPVMEGSLVYGPLAASEEFYGPFGQLSDRGGWCHLEMEITRDEFNRLLPWEITVETSDGSYCWTLEEFVEEYWNIPLVSLGWPPDEFTKPYWSDDNDDT